MWDQSFIIDKEEFMETPSFTREDPFLLCYNSLKEAKVELNIVVEETWH